MKLSVLAYECVKESVTIVSTKADYYTFTAGDLASNIEYKMQLESVFPAINRAISRLTTLDKINYQITNLKRIDEVYVKDNAIYSDKDCTKSLIIVTGRYYYDLASFSFYVGVEDYVTSVPKEKVNGFIGNEILCSVGEIINVGVAVKRFGNSFKKFDISRTNGNHLAFCDEDISNLDVIVAEIRRTIPHFSMNDIVKAYLEDNEVIDNNIELEQFGITNQMCDYIKEFVKSEINESIAPDMAIVYNNRAEAYFADISYAHSVFEQHHVEIEFGDYYG